FPSRRFRPSLRLAARRTSCVNASFHSVVNCRPRAERLPRPLRGQMAPALRTLGARCRRRLLDAIKQMTAANQAWTALVLQGKIWQGGLGQYCCPNVAALGPGSRRGNGDRRRPTGAATARPEALPLLANGWVANRGGLCGAAD